MIWWHHFSTHGEREFKPLEGRVNGSFCWLLSVRCVFCVLWPKQLSANVLLESLLQPSQNGSDFCIPT